MAGEVLLNYGGSVQPAMIYGILPEQEKKISELAQKMVSGKLTDLQPHRFGIVLGESLAGRLGAKIGDKVTVMTPQVSLTPAGVIPRYKRFTVVGIFRVGTGFGFDAGLGFVQLEDAQKLLGLGSFVTGLHLTKCGMPRSGCINYFSPVNQRRERDDVGRSIRRIFSCRANGKNHDVFNFVTDCRGCCF